MVRASAADNTVDGHVAHNKLIQHSGGIVQVASAGVREFGDDDRRGHNDPGFTLRVYTHLTPTSHERTRRAVDAFLGSGRPIRNVGG
ncbi:hypothetical protein [Actinophytocola glycyrrhizae]|uniref:Uncharacterized protein n=1 Tax=Actinophytocola glycyrrhizae TaxID=2044873 RepID=A0ABV9RW86_9PSEU